MTKETRDYLQQISDELDKMQASVRAQAGNTIENDTAVNFNRGALAALSAVKTEVLKCLAEIDNAAQPAEEPIKKEQVN